MYNWKAQNKLWRISYGWRKVLNEIVLSQVSITFEHLTGTRGLRWRYRRAEPSTMTCDGVTGGQDHRCLLSSAERRWRGKWNHADGRAQRKNRSKWVSSVKENFVEKDYRWKKSQWITLKSSFSGLKFRISVRKLFKHCCTSCWLGEVRV